MQLTTTNNKGFAPATLTEAIQFSEMLANSSMVPKAYQGKPQDILVCVQWGYEMGLAPMQALQNIAVINGKPSVYGDAALALVQASSVCEDVQETMEDEGTPNPVAVCVAKRKNRSPVVVRFSVEDAKRAGLWGKQGPWTQYPKRMMQMRARGTATRTRSEAKILEAEKDLDVDEIIKRYLKNNNSHLDDDDVDTMMDDYRFDEDIDDDNRRIRRRDEDRGG